MSSCCLCSIALGLTWKHKCDLIVSYWYKMYNDKDAKQFTLKDVLNTIYLYSGNEVSIRITHPKSLGIDSNHHLHIHQIEAFDQNGKQIKLLWNDKGSSLMKAGWMGPDGKRRTPLYCIDGDKESKFGFCHNRCDTADNNLRRSQDLWIEFDCKYEEIRAANELSKFVIYNRMDGGCSLRILGVIVELKENGKTVRKWTINTSVRVHTFDIESPKNELERVKQENSILKNKLYEMNQEITRLKSKLDRIHSIMNE